MAQCDHVNAKRYARRVFENGTIHYCVQCLKCLRVIKTEKHAGKLFIKHNEIPTNKKIHEFITREGE